MSDDGESLKLSDNPLTVAACLLLLLRAQYDAIITPSMFLALEESRNSVVAAHVDI